MRFRLGDRAGVREALSRVRAVERPPEPLKTLRESLIERGAITPSTDGGYPSKRSKHSKMSIAERRS